MMHCNRFRSSALIVLCALLAAVAGAVRPACARQGAPAAAPWWTHAVIYEIYVRSFQDSDGDGIGDLNGVTARLDYLQRLGVDAIWLTPFYPSPNVDFGYDVSDYENVAREYGSLADWDRLVREATRRHIRVLVDLVLNHSSDQHPWFIDSRSSRTSPRRDWYIWKDGHAQGGPPTNWQSIFGGPAWTLDPRTGQWYYHVFATQQPDFNWGSPGLRGAMFDVVRFWLDRGAAGFRLDATPYLFEDPAWPDDPDPASGAPVWLKPYNSGRPENHGVLREMRRIVDAYPGQRVLLGESATANIQELAMVYGRHHDEIHLPMDFLIGNLHRLDASVFKQQIDDAEQRLEGQPPVLFFSSHDHSRQWSSFGDGTHNDQIAKLTATLTLTPRGTALLYYGEEIGMRDVPAALLAQSPIGPKRPRADDRDVARSPMPWRRGAGAGFTHGVPWLALDTGVGGHDVEDEMQQPDSVYRWYARLLRLRRTNAALREGGYLPLSAANPNVLAFARLDRAGQGALVVLNMSPGPQSIAVTGWPGHAPYDWTTLLASPAVTAPSDRLTMAPYGVLIAGFASRAPGRHAAAIEQQLQRAAD